MNSSSAASERPAQAAGPAASGATPWSGILLALTGSIAFSGKAIIVKLSYRHGVDPLTVIMLRMAFALPLFLLLALWAGRGRPTLTRRDWGAVIGLGFSGYYLASTLDFIGLSYISASLERLIVYLTPTFVLVLGAVLFKRRVTARQMLASAVGYAGALLVFGQEMHFTGRDVLLGSVLVLGSAISYALYLIYCGEEVRKLGALRLTGLATSVACVLCIAQFALLRPVHDLVTVPEPVLWLAVLNALACTFAPVILVMMGIERIGATLAAQVGMVGPMSTIAMGVLLLDEPFTLWLGAGTLLVFAGIGLLARAR